MFLLSENNVIFSDSTKYNTYSRAISSLEDSARIVAIKLGDSSTFSYEPTYFANNRNRQNP